MRICCRHIIVVRRYRLTPLFSRDNYSPRWHREADETNENGDVFESAVDDAMARVMDEDMKDVSVDEEEPLREIKRIKTREQRFCGAKKLFEQFSALLSTFGAQKYQSTMKELTTAYSILQEGHTLLLLRDDDVRIIDRKTAEKPTKKWREEGKLPLKILWYEIPLQTKKPKILGEIQRNVLLPAEERSAVRNACLQI